MARLVYGGTPADFVVSPGALADVVDETGAPVVPAAQGWAALFPAFSGSFDVHDGVGGTQLTNLLAANGVTSITTVPFDGTFDSLGQIPRFFGPDGYEGDVWLTPTGGDGTRWARVAPSTDTLFTRVGATEAAVAGLATTNLADVSSTAPTDGQVLAWDNAVGEYVPAAAAGTGTVTSVAGVDPVAGDVPTASLKSALGTADSATLTALTFFLQTRTYVLCKPVTGGGYEAKPAGYQLAIRPGAEQPASQLADYDIWLQPTAEPGT